MPIFDEHCRACGLTFELLVLTTKEYIVECPRCHSRDCERLASLFNSHVKDSVYGYYRGDSSKPFENFTLQNVHDEKGKKVVVNSLSELRAAEKKYNFSLDVASMDKPHREADEAPQNLPTAGNIAADYDWKWCRTEQDRAASMASPIVQVDVGVAASEAETLAGKMKHGEAA